MKNPKSLANGHTLNLNCYIPALITFMSNKLSSGASACYREQFGVGVMEWRIMATLKLQSTISANQISQVIGLDKAAVSRTLKQLQQNALVSFVKDENDARSTLVTLTNKGQGLHDRILTVALARESILLEGLSSEEVNQLIGLLQKVKANIHATNAYLPTQGDKPFENA
ncbi:MarR family winged helix-turn-helix transcriptional regulator [Shewanella sp. UCD-KL21]|uniref:MarR family winged helix-turn-helix transcriptional regulator n=1 Tax=Shewanella sp. UCD-KL21 TaxID=1917164 RepID=UPI000970A2B1|nr:MarR family transcriptional regulator [Shewanella sp. UCD-KL21]